MDINDADWASSVVDPMNTSGCCFTLGPASSKKQKSVDLSTIEAEYIIVCMACCEAIWL